MLRRSGAVRLLLGRVSACVALIALTAASLAAAHADAGPAPRDARVDPQVYADLAAAPDGEATFIVLMEDQADLSGAAEISDWNARGRYVYETLRGTAARAQAPLLVAQRAAAIPGQISEVQPLWIVNAVVAHGDRRAAEALAQQPGVARVLPEVKMAPLQAPVDPALDAAAPLAVNWGNDRINAPLIWGNIDRINAPQVWANYNATGQGVTIGIVDTGVQWDHPALQPQYRGWNGVTADHSYNWFNPEPFAPCTDPTIPCDSSPIGHGTHVTGIAAGDDDGVGNPIGVAPGAQWIHALGCCPSDAALLEALQWMLAPTDLNGANPSPSLRPQVVNNSWGGLGGYLVFENAIAALRAAGIVPVFAAGNNGREGCGTLNSPADNPAAFSVGATNPDNVIYSRSSRGSNPFSGRTGPDLVAPGGGGIYSSLPPSTYGTLSGTSQAAPHVAGAVALLLSAEPALLGQVDQIEEVLRATSVPSVPPIGTGTCGGVPGSQTPNNVFGWGRLDVLAAVQMVWQAGTLSGVVTDAGTLSIAGATVSITRNNDTLTQATDAAGHYSFVAGAGTYEVKAEAFGYTTQTASEVSVSQKTTTSQNFALGTLTPGSISGVVLENVDPPNDPPKPVQVAILEILPVSAGLSAPTATDGAYHLTDVPSGLHTVRLRAPGYAPLTQSIDVSGAMTLNFAPAPVTDYALNAGGGGGVCSVQYAWIDATTGGTVYNLSDDGTALVMLPGPFTFYGNSYNSLYLSANGFLSFGAAYTLVNGVIPFEGPANNAIYAFADDLNPADGARGTIYTRALPDNRFVIQYNQVQHWPSGSPETFEIVLNPADGSILVQYQTVSLASNALVGIENADGSRGIRYSHANQPPITSELAVKFTPFSGQPPTCARAAAPLAEITLDGATAELKWQDVAPNQAYEIWRDAAPYFDPPQGAPLATVPAVPGEMIYPDTRPDGEPPANRFYLVRGRFAGMPSGPSNRVGEFIFTLTPGE